jgi:hypothetical protein
VTINRDILLRVDSTLFEEGLTIAQSTSDVERLRSAVDPDEDE